VEHWAHFLILYYPFKFGVAQTFVAKDLVNFLCDHLGIRDRVEGTKCAQVRFCRHRFPLPAT
jgi:hypothetical protein